MHQQQAVTKRQRQQSSSTDQDNVYLASSRIPNGGLGLFAKKAFPKKNMIITYPSGWLIPSDMAKLLKKAGQCTHCVLSPYRDFVLLGVRTPEELLLFDPDNRFLGTFINSSKNTDFLPNCYFDRKQRKVGDYRIPIKTSRPIEAGEELYIDYPYLLSSQQQLPIAIKKMIDQILSITPRIGGKQNVGISVSMTTKRRRTTPRSDEKQDDDISTTITKRRRP